MTTLIVIPEMCIKYKGLDRVLDDLFDAIEYEVRTGFVTRVELERFNRHGLPVYKKIPDDEMTDVELREMQAMLTLEQDMETLERYQDNIDDE